MDKSGTMYYENKQKNSKLIIFISVSYTHLDVYKRQSLRYNLAKNSKCGSARPDLGMVYFSDLLLLRTIIIFILVWEL